MSGIGPLLSAYQALVLPLDYIPVILISCLGKDRNLIGKVYTR